MPSARGNSWDLERGDDGRACGKLANRRTPAHCERGVCVDVACDHVTDTRRTAVALIYTHTHTLTHTLTHTHTHSHILTHTHTHSHTLTHTHA